MHAHVYRSTEILTVAGWGGHGLESDLPTWLHDHLLIGSFGFRAASGSFGFPAASGSFGFRGGSQRRGASIGPIHNSDWDLITDGPRSCSSHFQSPSTVLAAPCWLSQIISIISNDDRRGGKNRFLTWLFSFPSRSTCMAEEIIHQFMKIITASSASSCIGIFMNSLFTWVIHVIIVVSIFILVRGLRC